MNNILDKVKKNIVDNQESLLFGAGITAMLTSTIFAIASTVDVKSKLKNKTKKERIKILLKQYSPTIVFGIFGITGLIMAHHKITKKNMLLATACSVTGESLRSYRKQITDAIGEKEEKEILQKNVKKEISKETIEEQKIFTVDKHGELCYDTITGRYFYRNINSINACLNLLNKELLSGISVSLNDWYYILGLPQIEVGEILGWDVKDGLVELIYTSTISNDDKPCIVLTYPKLPIKL